MATATKTKVKETTELQAVIHYKNFMGSGESTETFMVAGPLREDNIRKAYKKAHGIPGIGACAKIYHGDKYLMTFHPVYSVSYGAGGRTTVKVSGRTFGTVYDESLGPTSFC